MRGISVILGVAVAAWAMLWLPTQHITRATADDFEVYTREFERAAKTAESILVNLQKQRQQIRDDYVVRMTGKRMSVSRDARWTEAALRNTFDASSQRIAQRIVRVRKLASHWHGQNYRMGEAAPALFEGPEDVDLTLEEEPGERIAPAALQERLNHVRVELDEMIVRSVAATWHDRIALAGFSDHHWGEVDAIAIEVERQLVQQRDQWETLRFMDRDRAEALRAELLEREGAIVNDPAVKEKLAAVTKRLEPLRIECARTLMQWQTFVEANFKTGPQAYRQALLDSLNKRINEMLVRDLTTLQSTQSWHDAKAEGPFLKDPREVSAPRGEWQNEKLTLYTRPDFAGDLRELAAGEAAPLVVGHKELMDVPPVRLPRVYAAVVVRRTLSEDPTDRLLDPEAPPFMPTKTGVTLCVFGDTLIDDEGRRRPITGQSDRARYTVISSRPGIYNLQDNHACAALYRDGFAAVSHGLHEIDAQPFRYMDAWIVNVELDKGLLPGPQSFRIGEAEGMWVLPYAITRGTLEFVRERPARPANEADRPDEFFVFDRFAVQIETDVPLGVDSLPVVVVHNGRPLQLRRSADGSGDGILMAHKVPGFPKLLRTRTVFIEGDRATPDERVRSDMHYATMQRGDAIMATTDGPLFEAPAVDMATILATPGEIAIGDGKGMLFTEAVADAARIHGVNLPNLDLSNDQVVDTITHTIVFNWQRHNIEFSLADHAAMLLMKRTFIHMARQRLASLEELHADDALVRAHVPVMIEHMRAGARVASDGGSTKLFPLGYVHRIKLPRGAGLTPFGQEERSRYADVPLITAFQTFNRDRYFTDTRLYEQWQFDATREAIRVQIEQTQRAIEFARAADDDDVEELLELTGRGFAPVIECILPRLVALRSDAATFTMEWLPNERARRAVIQVSNTLAEHDTAGKAAREDTEALLAVLSGVGLGAGANVVGKSILVIGSSLSIGVATNDLIELHHDKAEVRFAANALEIIGRDRLQFDLREKQIGGMPYVAMALTVVGFRMDIGDLVRTVRASAARQVAEQWMSHVAREGMSAMTEVPLKDKSMLYLLMKEAEQAKAAGRRLTEAQEMALRARDTIESQMNAAHPWLTPEIVSPTPAIDETRLMTEGRAALPLPQLPYKAPRPGYLVEVPGSNVTYLVGKPLGKGAYATTYELLDEFGAPTGNVIKFLREPFADSAEWIARMRKDYGNLAVEELGTNSRFDDTPLPEVIDRMMHGQALLKAANIPHLPMTELDEAIARAGRNANPPFVIQRTFQPGPDFVIPKKEVGLTDPGMHAAVAKLYKQIADANLVWKDGHIENIYLRRIDDEWVAGVLDTDMLVHWDEAIENPFLRQKILETFAIPHLRGINSIPGQARLFADEAGPDIVRRVSPSPHAFMAKMLEHRGWIAFDPLPVDRIPTERRLGDFRPLHLKIEAVRDHFGDINEFVTLDRQVLDQVLND